MSILYQLFGVVKFDANYSFIFNGESIMKNKIRAGIILVLFFGVLSNLTAIIMSCSVFEKDGKMVILIGDMHGQVS